MSNPLLDLLTPRIDLLKSTKEDLLAPDEAAKYLDHLCTCSLHDLNSRKPHELAQSSQSQHVALKTLASRSNSALVRSSGQLKHLQAKLGTLVTAAASLQQQISTLDTAAVDFSEKYTRSKTNAILERRARALLTARNVDRLTDILGLTTLLDSTIASAITPSNSSNVSGYNSALDLFSYIKRLRLTFPESPTVRRVIFQAEVSIERMITNLIDQLRGHQIKLTSAMRAIGCLRRMAPELAIDRNQQDGASADVAGHLLLTCRFSSLVSVLSALRPLKELADQERSLRAQARDKSESTLASNGKKEKELTSVSNGYQTERYLKKYIEVFREHSFAIISLYKSIFSPTAQGTASNSQDSKSNKFMRTNAGSTGPMLSTSKSSNVKDSSFDCAPSALATFPLRIAQLLGETLKYYMPNIVDAPTRESILTQVLYCATSLGRLDADFGLVLADSLTENYLTTKSVKAPIRTSDCGLESTQNPQSNGNVQIDENDKVIEQDETDEEWVAAMLRHRALSEKLQSLVVSS